MLSSGKRGSKQQLLDHRHQGAKEMGIMLSWGVGGEGVQGGGGGGYWGQETRRGGTKGIRAMKHLIWHAHCQTFCSGSSPGRASG